MLREVEADLEFSEDEKDVYEQQFEDIDAEEKEPSEDDTRAKGGFQKCVRKVSRVFSKIGSALNRCFKKCLQFLTIKGAPMTAVQKL